MDYFPTTEYPDHNDEYIAREHWLMRVKQASDLLQLGQCILLELPLARSALCTADGMDRAGDQGASGDGE